MYSDTNFLVSLNEQLLAQLTDLQATVAENLVVRNEILNLIGNIFTLKTRMTSGKATDADFTFFIANIQNGLQKISSVINKETTTTTSETTVTTNTKITNIQTIIQSFQTMVSSGDTTNIGEVLEQV